MGQTLADDLIILEYFPDVEGAERWLLATS